MKSYIPLLPSLSLGAFFKKKAANLPYPLSEQYTGYYFERNAIWQGLKDVGLKEGDEILFPAYNSGTEEEVVEQYGLDINYYDTEKDTRVSTLHLEGRVTKDTKALYLVHFFGIAQPMEEVVAFCEKHNLILIEDCALSLFSHNNNKPLGSYGAVSFFCLRKYLPIPNGGILIRNTVTENADTEPFEKPSKLSTLTESVGMWLSGKVRIFQWMHMVITAIKKIVKAILGKLKADSGAPNFDVAHRNWSMSKISARLLSRIDYAAARERRKMNYAYLTKRLTEEITDDDEIALFNANPQEGFEPFCMLVLVNDNLYFEQELKRRGIECGAWWYIDQRPDKKPHCPNNTWLRKFVLEIPIQQDLGKFDMETIVSELLKVARKEK